MLLFMNHCNDIAPCGPSIGQYNSYTLKSTCEVNLLSKLSIIVLFVLLRYHKGQTI